MNDFIEWVCDPDTPAYMMVLFIAAAACSGMFLFVLMMIMVISGYWLIPVVLLVLVPGYVVIRAYLEDNK